MVKQVWLNEGDIVLTEISWDYFNDLINFVKERGLKKEFEEWKLSNNK